MQCNGLRKKRFLEEVSVDWGGASQFLQRCQGTGAGWRAAGKATLWLENTRTSVNASSSVGVRRRENVVEYFLGAILPSLTRLLGAALVVCDRKPI